MKEFFKKGHHREEHFVRTMPQERRAIDNRVAHTWNQVAEGNADAMAEQAYIIRAGLLRLVKFAKSITGGRGYK